MDILIQGFKEFINKLNTKYQELRSKWQEYREKDVLFQSFRDAINVTKDNVKDKIKETKEKIDAARQKFQNFMNNDDDQLILDDLITKNILNAQFNQSYKQLNEDIAESDPKTKFETRKEDFKKMIILKNKTYQDKPKLDPSEDMMKEINTIKKEKEGIFTRIYESFYPGKSFGGLSTRRKRKRRPKFHQVRSYKQRPKQHRLK